MHPFHPDIHWNSGEGILSTNACLSNITLRDRSCMGKADAKNLQNVENLNSLILAVMMPLALLKEAVRHFNGTVRLGLVRLGQ